MRDIGLYCGVVCVVILFGIGYSTALDIKTKRGIEKQQDGFVEECAWLQNPDAANYVEVLRNCRAAAELKYKMPEYLSRVR